MFEKIKTNNVMKNESGDLPATTAVISNNQIGKYISEDNATVLSNVFSATANGFGKAFYQPHKFTVLQDSYAFKFKDESINIERIHPFITSCLNKVYSKYDWTNKSGWAKIENETIPLPLTTIKTIDFDFMERFIAQLEEERIEQLEAYLSATGLKDFVLTAEEEKALADFDKVEWGEFRIGELFDVDSWEYGRNQQYEQKSELNKVNSTPVISGVTVNNGIAYYTEDSIDKSKVFKDELTISTRGEYSGTVFYHSYEFALANNILVMRMPNLTKNQKLFFGATINALNYGGYSGYPKKETLKNDYISLPLTTIKVIDFDYIHTLITAIQKLVIKDVVQYADAKIKATESVVRG